MSTHFILSRRKAILGALGGAGLGLMAGLPRSSLAASGARPTPRLNASEALNSLMAGNARYVANQPNALSYVPGRAALTTGQSPFAIILSCADSRITPEFAFDQRPGDLFVTRVAGNYVTVDSLATIEYGVEFLGASLIMVLGHTSCGALSAAVEVARNATVLPGSLPKLVAQVIPAVERVKAEKGMLPPAEMAAASIIENVRENVERLRTAAPLLSHYAERGEINVVGGLYHLGTGQVEIIGA